MNTQSIKMREKELATFFTLLGASMFGESIIIRDLLKEGVNVNLRLIDLDTKDFERDARRAWISEIDTPLLVAVKHTADTETIKLLLENGADINARDKNGNTPLKIAKEKGYEDIVKLLISK